jgi:hypothetical protein
MFAFNTLRGEIMQHIFVELYNYRPAWAKRSENERTDFVNKVIEAVNRLKSAGVEVIAYGKNSLETDRRAPYDFFCVYRVPNAEFQREFERQITASGWYDYFEQVNISGPAEDFAAVLRWNAKIARPS